MVSFRAPSICGVLIFPTYILLFWVFITKEVGFCSGYIWGVVAYGFYFLPLFFCLASLAQTWHLYCAWVGFVLYCSVFSGFWFYLVGVIQKKLTKPAFRIISAILITFGHIIFIDKVLLCIFDVVEGLPILNPLIPLVSYSFWLGWLPVFGIMGMWFLFLVTVSSMTLFFINPIKYHFLFVFLILFFWFFPSIFFHHISEKPSWLNYSAALQPQAFIYEKEGLYACIGDICSKIVQVRKNNPSLHYIFMPESTLPFVGDHVKKACSCLSENNQDITMVLGGYSQSFYGIYNSCYIFEGGKIAVCCNKSHGIPFVERIPYLFDYHLFRSWFLLNQEPFELDKHMREPVILDTEFDFIPALCSELFFSNDIYRNASDKIILGLVNDGWFIETFFPDLLWSCAQLRARSYSKPLLYVSYTRALFLDKDGSVVNIQGI